MLDNLKPCRWSGIIIHDADYSGYWSNPKQIRFDREKVVESSIRHIDAIDKALAEREGK